MIIFDEATFYHFSISPFNLNPVNPRYNPNLPLRRGRKYEPPTSGNKPGFHKNCLANANNKMQFNLPIAVSGIANNVRSVATRYFP